MGDMGDTRDREKRKSIIKKVLIFSIVFIVGFVINIILCIKMSRKAYEENKIWVNMNIPNGYISKAYDTLGFLGGKSSYKISKKIGNKSVILEDTVTGFGILPELIFTRMSGSSSSAGEWTYTTWESGYRKMIFFHPNIDYKEYKNDLKELDKLQEGKLIEMAISFDKSYKFEEIPVVMPKVNKSWYWIDAFTKYEMDELKENAKNRDAKASYISEGEVWGVEDDIERYYVETGESTTKFTTLLQQLKNSDYKRYNDIYEELIAKGYKQLTDVPILGVVVYGTKEELKTLIENPHIKGSSFGVITDIY